MSDETARKRRGIGPLPVQKRAFYIEFGWA
jgi:hypothetical protein